MGDRANVYIHCTACPNDPGVYLYTHWQGESLPAIVQEVLKRKRCWGDAAYLARMVFSAMVKYDIDGATGYGITAYLTDNARPIIVLDCSTQRIGFADPLSTTEKPFDDGVIHPKPETWLSFAEFVELNEVDYPF